MYYINRNAAQLAFVVIRYFHVYHIAGCRGVGHYVTNFVVGVVFGHRHGVAAGKLFFLCLHQRQEFRTVVYYQQVGVGAIINYHLNIGETDFSSSIILPSSEYKAYNLVNSEINISSKLFHENRDVASFSEHK